jgi:hypothetical protein
MADTKVTASFSWRGLDMEGIPVCNPGGWFGSTWLIEVGVGYSSFYYVVEADCDSDAIDEFSESEHGHLIHIAPEDLADYGEDCYFDGVGNPCDLSNLMIHGAEITPEDTPPFPIRYHGRYDGLDLPARGIKPTNLHDFWLHFSWSKGA